MVSLAGPTPTPWPRMPSGQRNPFQNAPGLFIYALPNLAGTCPFAFSDTASDLVCPFADSAAAAPGRRHHNECYHHPAVASCCDQRHPASESESESAESESNAESVSELDSPLPAQQQQQQQQPLLPVDESHFDLGDIRSSSLTTEGYHDGAKFCTTQQKQRQQNQPERSREPSTPTHSHTLSSPMGSEFTEAKDPVNEDEDEDGEEDGEEQEERKEKRKRRPRKRRRRTKGRLPSEEAGCVMGPRMMGLSGLHFDRWTRYVCPAPPPPPPPPAAMKPHTWFVAPGFDAFAPRTGARFWDPPMAVQAVQVPGLVSVSCW